MLTLCILLRHTMLNTIQNMVEFQPDSNLSTVFQKEFEDLAKFYSPVFDLENHETSSIKAFLEAFHLRLTKLADSKGSNNFANYAEKIKKLNAGILKIIKGYKICISKLPNTDNFKTLNNKYHSVLNDLSRLISDLILQECLTIGDDEHSKRLEYLQIISLFTPALQVFCNFSLQIAILFSSLDKATNDLFINSLREIKILVTISLNAYAKLQIERIAANYLQPLWVDIWENDLYPVLYAHSLCDSLEKLKEYSQYWLFIVDGEITLKAKSASMKKFKDFHNKVCYHDYEFATKQRKESIISEKTLSGYDAGLPDPMPIKVSLARLLKDSQISNMELSANIICAKIEIIDSYLNKHDLSLIFLEAILQETNSRNDNYHKFLKACCQNLSQQQKNLLLLWAAKVGELSWFKIFLEAGAKCFDPSYTQENLLSIALDAPDKNRDEILRTIAKSDKKELLLCQELKSEKLANYRVKHSGNTILHELLIQKIGYNFIVAYCTLNKGIKLNNLIFATNNNGDSIKKIASKNKKSDLLHKIEQFQIHIFTRALYEKNLSIIAAHLRDNGNPNILENGQHTLEIIWGYLKKQDAEILEILEYLVENKCDVNAKVCDGKTLGDAIRDNLTKKAQPISFFKKADNILQSALKIITPHEEAQKYLTILKDIYLLDTFKIQPEMVRKINFILVAYFTKIIFVYELNKHDSQQIALLMLTQMCLILLNKFEAFYAKEPKQPDESKTFVS